MLSGILNLLSLWLEVFKSFTTIKSEKQYIQSLIETVTQEAKVSNRLMILPAKDVTAIRLVRIPEDYEEHEVFRHVTGIIASVEEQNPDYSWEDIQAELEDHGFEPLTFILGPELD